MKNSQTSCLLNSFSQHVNRAGGVTYLSSCTGRPHSSSWKAAYRGSMVKNPISTMNYKSRFINKSRLYATQNGQVKSAKYIGGRKQNQISSRKWKYVPLYITNITHHLVWNTGGTHNSICSLILLEGIWGKGWCKNLWQWIEFIS